MQKDELIDSLEWIKMQIRNYRKDNDGMSGLIFDNNRYKVKHLELDGMIIDYRAYENIVYVSKPVDSLQRLSIYVPECFYKGKEIHGYNLNNAPIFMPNSVGGYMPGPIEEPGKHFYTRHINSLFMALKHGYVVVSAGARGNGCRDEHGKNIGCAPAGLCDLKAAIRYLKFNANRIPGDVNKIVTNGTSAGGAMSALLGATGNHPDYECYLEQMGAAKASDDVWASSCYCPITNLENADMAYEWEFNGLNDYHRIQFIPPKTKGEAPTMLPVDADMNEEQISLSKVLKDMFPGYLNGLKLIDENGVTMTLDKNGNGTFKEFIIRYVIAATQEAIDQGVDASGFDWFTLEDGKVTAVDFDKYVLYRTRMKETPAFDNLSVGTPEHMLFATENDVYRHFTSWGMNYSHTDWFFAENKTVKMMNPMNYIDDPNATTAKFYRIRHGAIDRDTSLAVSAMLTLKLRMAGTDVDYKYPWETPHSGDYDLEELFDWIDRLAK